MKILISGCSFTKWPEYPGGPNICWPKYLTGQNITNVAEAAAGNQYISDSVVRGTLADNYDLVLVMWTGVSRLDYLTNIEDLNWNALFDSYGFYRRLPHNKLGYIFSGGQMGTWFKNPVAHKMFYEMYKVSSELSLAAINLMEIVKCQGYLKSKNVNYRFMSYVDYWNDLKELSPNGDFGVAGFPEVQDLIKEIDFSKWIFDGGTRCIYDVAKDMNSFQPDGFHPGDAANQYWADLITKEILSAV